MSDEPIKLPDPGDVKDLLIQIETPAKQSEPAIFYYEDDNRQKKPLNKLFGQYACPNCKSLLKRGNKIDETFSGRTLVKKYYACPHCNYIYENCYKEVQPIEVLWGLFYLCPLCGMTLDARQHSGAHYIGGTSWKVNFNCKCGYKYNMFTYTD